MLKDVFHLRPRYDEVDQMGYVYHANYVSYCHQARTELMRKLGIPDKVLEENQLMLPVISFNIRYLQPSGYDELLRIKTYVDELPKARMHFRFEVENEAGKVITKASSEVVFVDKETRKPMAMPELIATRLKPAFGLAAFN